MRAVRILKPVRWSVFPCFRERPFPGFLWKSIDTVFLMRTKRSEEHTSELQTLSLIS